MHKPKRSGAYPGCIFATLGVVCLSSSPVFAEGNTIGLAFATQRNPSDFDKAAASVAGISYSHAFANNVIFDASVHYFDVAYSSAWHLNSQAGLGYRFVLSDIFSVVGIASIGSRVQSNDVDFPYYSLHGSFDWKLTEIATWSVVTYRYRNAFNTAYKFETPALGTALGFRLSDATSLSINYLREWENGKLADNLIGVGFQFHF